MGRTVWRKARGIGSSLPRPDAGRLPAVAFGNALPNATTYHLGMSADAHEKPDIFVPADVLADPLIATGQGGRVHLVTRGFDPYLRYQTRVARKMRRLLVAPRFLPGTHLLAQGTKCGGVVDRKSGV